MVLAGFGGPTIIIKRRRKRNTRIMNPNPELLFLFGEWLIDEPSSSKAPLVPPRLGREVAQGQELVSWKPAAQKDCVHVLARL